MSLTVVAAGLLSAIGGFPMYTEGVLPAPGVWLIFGVIGLPVYAILLGWYLGKPRDLGTTTMGVGYLVGLTVLLWTALYLLTVVIDLLFFF